MFFFVFTILLLYIYLNLYIVDESNIRVYNINILLVYDGGLRIKTPVTENRFNENVCLCDTVN